MNEYLDRLVRIEGYLIDPEKGLIVKLDRLAQSEERRRIRINAALTAAISALVVHVLKALHLV